MTKIGRKNEAELLAAFICIVASEGIAGRILDGLCVVIIFHITNLIFGSLKRFLNPAFQFPFLAVCILTFSEAVYIISDRFEFPYTLLGPALLSGAVLLLHLGTNTFFTERGELWKDLKKTNWQIGILLILMMMCSIVINLFCPHSIPGALALQLICGAFVIAILNRLFQIVRKSYL